ncbi:MAG TPA: hypothetical protein VJ385_02185 [Fibrobacteria bacterium]|nr:hypothetical protein [Fibrobacteria bacterium]
MKEILTTLFRRKRAFLAFFVFMVAFPMIMTYVLPAKYKGKATLLLTTGRFKKPFLPDEAGSKSGYMQVSMEDVGSEVELLASYPVLEKVVEENHLYADNPPPKDEWFKWAGYRVSKGVHHALVAVGLRPDVPPKDAAIASLRSKLNVDFVKRTNIFTVTLKGTSPEEARDVVNSVVDAYLWHHIRVHGNARALDAVKKEMESSGERLRAAEDSLNLYSKLNSISDVESQRQHLMARLGDAESKVQLLENVSRKNLSPDVLGSLSEDAAIGELSKRLTDAEMRRIDLTTRYAGDDRKLVATNQEIEELRRLIIQRAERSLNTWKSLSRTYRAQLARLDFHKVDIDRYKQGIEDLSRIFQLNREKTDEILISQAMDKAAMASARVVEYAVADHKPVFPNRIPMLIISIFFGVLFGGVYAIALDKLSLRVLSVADVEQASGVPVLASLPQYKLHSQASRTEAASNLARDLIPAGLGLFQENGHPEGNGRLHTVLLTSPSAGAGTSFLCDHLALMLAPSGNTLVLSFTYGDPTAGQADLLSACSSDFPMQRYLVQDEKNRVVRLCLSLLPGQLSLYENPTRVLMESLHRAGIRYLLIDAGSHRGDTLHLKFVPMVEHILLVAAYNVTSKPALGRMAEVIRRHKGNLTGCVFNRREDVIPEFLYQRL